MVWHRPGQPGHRRRPRGCPTTTAAGPRGPRALPARSPSGSGAPTRGASSSGPATAAEQLGAATVVVHPPFRWQREYARAFVEGIARMEAETDVVFAVENMYPVAGAAVASAGVRPATGTPAEHGLPTRHPRPVAHGGVRARDAVEMAAASSATGSRTCTSPTGPAPPRTSTWCPGAAPSRARRCSSCWPARGFAGTVVLEVSTPARPSTEAEREADLAEALAFARLNLAAVAVTAGTRAAPPSAIEVRGLDGCVRGWAAGPHRADLSVAPPDRHRAARPDRLRQDAR